MDRQVLVTGAAGFVGVNIVKHMAEEGSRVLALDHISPDRLVMRYLHATKGVKWLKADVTDSSALGAIARRHRISGVVHAAAITASLNNWDTTRTGETLRTNVGGTTCMFELAQKAKVRRFVYVSSSVVYGTGDGPERDVTEDCVLPPLSRQGLYGFTKILGEEIVRKYSVLSGISATSVRIGSPYGCMDRTTGSRKSRNLILNLIRAMLRIKRGKLRVRGLDYSRDWTFVADTASGLAAALHATGPLEPVYNVSAGTNVAVRDILRELRGILDLDLDWEEADRKGDADFDVEEYAPSYSRGPLSIERARRDLGFHPKYGLHEGLREYVDWYSSMKGEDLLR